MPTCRLCCSPFYPPTQEGGSWALLECSPALQDNCHPAAVGPQVLGQSSLSRPKCTLELHGPSLFPACPRFPGATSQVTLD